MVYTVVNTGSSSQDYDADEVDQPVAKARSDGFWNLELELRAIKTILTPTSDWAAKVYAICKQEFFHQSTTKAIFLHIQSLLASSGSVELPTLDFVLSDSKLSPSIRETVTAALAGENVVIVASQGDFDILVRGLSSLAKTRALYKAAQTATNDLLDSDTPEQLVKQVTNTLGQSLFAVEADDELLAQISMGRPYNQAAEDAFNRILNGSFEKVKIKTGFREFDEKTGGFHRTNLVILGGNSGGGKCCHFDTLIPTTQGLFKIGNLYNLFAKPDDKGWIPVPAGTLQVYTREGIKDVDGVFKTEGSTYKIITKWRDEFEGLGEHKLYCYDNSKQEFGFKRLDEIQVGIDWILKAVGTNLYGESVAIPYIPPALEQNGNRHEDVSRYPEKLTNELATLFGLVVAEGHRAFSFTNTDPMLLDYVISSLRNHFGCERKVTRSGYAVNFNEILQHYFTHFLGDVKSAERFVPSCIMQAPEEFQRAFLSGLFEGDGCIYEVNKGGKKGKDSKVWSLEMTTISHRLVYDVKALLENLGIYCKVEKKDTWASNGSESQVAKDGYTLYVIRESYSLFQEKIGFMSDRKKTELLRCVEHCDKMTKEGNPN
jgi:replicative DNA helicase